MINALRHLNSKDKQALAAFLGLALLCFLYFASGILVTYVSAPDNSIETALAAKGFTVRVLGLDSQDIAEKLSAALQDQRHLPAVIETNSSTQGYSVKVGPLLNRGEAESLSKDLHTSGYEKVLIVESCPPGTAGCQPEQAAPAQ
jgi:hypothetical protein